VPCYFHYFLQVCKSHLPIEPLACIWKCVTKHGGKADGSSIIPPKNERINRALRGAVGKIWEKDLEACAYLRRCFILFTRASLTLKAGIFSLTDQKSYEVLATICYGANANKYDIK
jgi:hypothetical protein